MAQFEISKKITTTLSKRDLPFIYDLTINNCCLFKAISKPSKSAYFHGEDKECGSKRKRKYIPEAISTNQLLQKVKKRLTAIKIQEEEATVNETFSYNFDL